MIPSKLYLHQGFSSDLMGYIVRIERLRYHLDRYRGRLYWWRLTAKRLPDDKEVERKIAFYEDKVFELTNELIEAKHDLYTNYPFIEEVY